MNDDQYNALLDASDAVEAATSPADRAVLLAVRNELIITVHEKIIADHPGVYQNRWGPRAISDIAAATGLSRVQVSRIVNDTPVVRGRPRLTDTEQD